MVTNAYDNMKPKPATCTNCPVTDGAPTYVAS